MYLVIQQAILAFQLQDLGKVYPCDAVHSSIISLFCFYMFLEQTTAEIQK